MKKEIESKLSFSDRISAHVKVKVTKKEPDANRFLCGDPVKIDKEGNEYFIIPEHQAKYIAETFPRYTVSKGYLSPDALADLNAESSSNKQSAEEGEDPALTDSQELPVNHKPRGNPNWRKKRIVPVEAEQQLTEV